MVAKKVSIFNSDGTNQRATVIVGLGFRGTDGELYVVDGDQTTGGMNVNASFSPPALQNVNITQIGSSTVLTDYGLVTTNSQRIVANMSVAGAAVATGNPVPITPGSGVVFAVSASALPLPAGASTVAQQSTSNVYLSNVDNTTTALNLKFVSSSWPAGQFTLASQSTGVQLSSSLSLGWDGATHREIAVSTAGVVKVDGSAVTQPVSIATFPLPTGAATEATLSALNAKVTTVNTGAVAVASSALPTGAATETTLASLNTKVTAVNTGAVVVASSALPAGASTETTLAALNTKTVTWALGAGTVATAARVYAIPGNVTGIVDFGAGSTGTQTQRAEANLALAGVAASSGIGASGTGTQRVQLANESLSNVGTAAVVLVSSTQRSYIIDMSTTNMTTTYLQIILSTPSAINAIEVFNGSGEPMFFATGAAASEVAQYIIPPGGTTGFVKLSIAAASRLAVKSFANTVNSGYFILNTLS